MDATELAWLQLEQLQNESQDPKNNYTEEKVCKQCHKNDIVLYQNESICSHCGLVIHSFLDTSCVSYENEVAHTFNKTAKNDKMKKMQDWYMWTNEEKNAYKLAVYTKSLCKTLNITETFQQLIADTVIEVMTIIRKHDGTKRARVKDGIILCCIQYVTKTLQQELSAIALAKKMNLDIKYVTRAEKIILELINSKKLHLNKSSILETKDPFSYVMDVINKKSIKVSDDILIKISNLIDYCQANDLLLDHTPLSIGVCCFYYVLKLNDMQIDMKVFSELYDLSIVTVIKTHNKLKSRLNASN